MSKTFKEFTRDEAYAFRRMTAIITTFLISASFTIYSISCKRNNPWDKILLQIVIGSGVATILLVYWRIHRTLFNYYNKLDKPDFKNTKEYGSITKNEGKWQKVIRATFFLCFAGFLGYVIVFIYF